MPTDGPRSRLIAVQVFLTLLLSGRAMTLWFLPRVGGPAPGDPPLVWLMPLLGDAVIGVVALFVAAALWRRPGPVAGLFALTWNALAIWDALSAFVVNRTTPWPDFFMVRAFGDTMFFLAAGMHAVCIGLLFAPAVRSQIWGRIDLLNGATPRVTN